MLWTMLVSKWEAEENCTLRSFMIFSLHRMKGNEMDGTNSTQVVSLNKSLIINHERKRALGIFRHRHEDNSETDSS
jgi:hypothetical protein